MRGDYISDRRRSDLAIPDVQMVLRTEMGWPTVIAPEQMDRYEATDLLIDRIVDGRRPRIVVRCRSFSGYFDRYKSQFTLRSRRKFDKPVELPKIVAGWGDYMHYGFLDGIVHRYYLVIDLAILRLAMAADMEFFSTKDILNRDGETWFRAFSINRLMHRGFNVVVKQGEPLDSALTLEQVQEQLRGGVGSAQLRQQLWRRLDFLTDKRPPDRLLPKPTHAPPIPGVGYDADGHFIHTCEVCGRDAGYGFGVHLMADKLGRWFCAEHKPPTGSE